jgi:hypothetical protein
MVTDAPIHRPGTGDSARFLAQRQTLNDRDANANLAPARDLEKCAPRLRLRLSAEAEGSNIDECGKIPVVGRIGAASHGTGGVHRRVAAVIGVLPALALIVAGSCAGMLV